MVTLITRFIFMVAGAVGGLAAAQAVEWENQIPGLEGLPRYYVIIIFIILGWSFGYLLGGILGRELTRIVQGAEQRLSELASSDIVLAVIGMLVGLIATVLFAWPLRLLQPTWLAVIASLALAVLGAYAGVRVAMTKRVDFARLMPSPARDGSVGVEELQVLLDTSAVIDGRFIELHKLGYLSGKLRVPRFVLAELQTLADSADDTKRARGRRGLDLLSTAADDVSAYEIDYPEIPGVDDKLMRLSAETGSPIVTVDYNLSKVARVRALEVLNISELAAVVRPTFLPGERLHLRITKQGKEADQGVGYLEDGTMVVVQDGHDFVGSDIDAEVTSVLQTSAGRMIFARPGRQEALA